MGGQTIQCGSSGTDDESVPEVRCHGGADSVAASATGAVQAVRAPGWRCRHQRAEFHHRPRDWPRHSVFRRGAAGRVVRRPRHRIRRGQWAFDRARVGPAAGDRPGGLPAAEAGTTPKSLVNYTEPNTQPRDPAPGTAPKYMIDLSIVIPIHNEEPNLEAL